MKKAKEIKIEKTYRIYLHEIKYGGENIGDDLTFTIKVGSGGAVTITPQKIKKTLAAGKTEKDFRTLVFTGSTKEKDVDLEATVDVLEVDKISDPGTVKQKFKVDMEKPFGQTFSVTVEAKAKGGDAPKVGKFTLTFGIEPPFVIQAKSKSKAEAGPFQKDGKIEMSSKEHVDAEQAYSSKYDGPTEFYVEYLIVLDEKGKLDTKKSVAKFKCINYTARGIEKPSTFITHDIPITSVSFGADKSVIDSLKVEAELWYPNLEKDFGLKDKKLEGVLDLAKKKADYTSSYYYPKTGVITNYKVTGDITDKPKPKPKDEDNPIPSEDDGAYLAPNVG